MTDYATNGDGDTGRFKMLADWEHDIPEDAPEPPASPPDIRIHPYMSVKQIAELCERHDCHCRVDVVNGQPHAYLVKNLPADFIPAFLRKQAT